MRAVPCSHHNSRAAAIAQPRAEIFVLHGLEAERTVFRAVEIGGKSPVARAIDKGKIFPARHLFPEIKMIQKPVFILAKDVTYVVALQIKSVCFGLKKDHFIFDAT